MEIVSYAYTWLVLSSFLILIYYFVRDVPRWWASTISKKVEVEVDRLGAWEAPVPPIVSSLLGALWVSYSSTKTL